MSDPNRTHVTIGGNTINYIGDCGTKTASLETVKLVVNSTLSTPDAEYMTMDLSNFYLGTPLDRPEFVQIKLSVIPQEVIDAYGLEKYAYNGWVYFEISKGMYGLKQAGKLANELLATSTRHLAKGTTNVPPHQAYGGTNGDQSSSHSSSTTLASNTQIVSMPITYWQLYQNTMKLPPIGLDQSFQVLTLNGITRSVPAASPWTVISKTYTPDLDIPSQ